ncbi:hypothetical protein [Variovorax sp. GT1P44]|uniref:hypothetical protein n=1 Tax=Variovorax sp. GT1P44 TaxID=3443742 RepID=UPI003F45FD8E
MQRMPGLSGEGIQVQLKEAARLAGMTILDRRTITIEALCDDCAAADAMSTRASAQDSPSRLSTPLAV